MAIMGRLAKRILKKTLQRRSPVYRWLWQNHAEISVAMSNPRPSWIALAEAAAEAGCLDSAGKPPNANSIRATWLRVCRDIGQAGATGQGQPAAPQQQPVPGAPAVPPPAAPPPIVQPPGQVPPDDGAADDEDYTPRPKYVFKPGKFRE